MPRTRKPPRRHALKARISKARAKQLLAKHPLEPGTLVRVPSTHPEIAYMEKAADGRICWPKIFVYEWEDENGQLFRTGVRPPRMPKDVQLSFFKRERYTGGRMPHPEVQSRTYPYTYEVYLPDEFDRLMRLGWLNDPRHVTGEAVRPEYVDERVAPATT